jgi:hypothetical protein
MFGSCNQNSNTDSKIINPITSNKKFRLLTSGYPDGNEKEAAKYLVGEKWGIEFLIEGGCIIESELSDSIEKENKRVESLIENKYGIDWRWEFQKEVNEELIRQNAVIELVDKEKNVISKKRELENESIYYLEYTSKPITQSEYKVNVCGQKLINGNRATVSYFRFFVNVEKHSVILISNNIIIIENGPSTIDEKMKTLSGYFN